MRHEKSRSEGRTIRVAPWIFALAMAAAVPAGAQSAGGSQALGAAVKAGDSVIVKDRAGTTARGTVSDVSASVLRVDVDGAVREWAAPDVVEVRRRGDSLANGTLWGLVAGAGGAVAWGGVVFASCGNDGGVNCNQLKTQSVLIPLVAGPGLGLLIDALRTGEKVVYKQPALTVVPSVAPGGSYAVTAAWSF